MGGVFGLGGGVEAEGDAADGVVEDERFAIALEATEEVVFFCGDADAGLLGVDGDGAEVVGVATAVGLAVSPEGGGEGFSLGVGEGGGVDPVDLGAFL